MALLEQSVIELLRTYNIHAARQHGKPGVWIAQGKIAAMGIRIGNGVAYHGMALNVHVDMRYFDAINPCGLGLQTINLCDIHANRPPLEAIFENWAAILNRLLSS